MCVCVYVCVCVILKLFIFHNSLLYQHLKGCGLVLCRLIYPGPPSSRDKDLKKQTGKQRLSWTTQVLLVPVMGGIFEPHDAAALWQYRSFYIPRARVWGMEVAFRFVPAFAITENPFRKGCHVSLWPSVISPTLGIPLLAQRPPGGPSFLALI